MFVMQSYKTALIPSDFLSMVVYSYFMSYQLIWKLLKSLEQVYSLHSLTLVPAHIRICFYTKALS